MADTTYVKTVVEPWVRSWLSTQYPAHIFKPQLMPLVGVTRTTPGYHEFDAVSEDKSIISAIKGHSFKTSGGNLPQAKFASLYQELYFLSLVKAKRRLLILTNKEMYTDFVERSKGKVADDVEIIYCQLPEDLGRGMINISNKASKEMSV